MSAMRASKTVKTRSLTANRLRELIDYCPHTGLFTWKVDRSPQTTAGSVAGALDHRGYVLIGVDGVKHKAHRLAVLWMTGHPPSGDVDHRNRVHDDNRWKNLRHATRSQNNCNSCVRSNNTSGSKGVSWISRDKRWKASICVNGKEKHLGYFEDFDEAVEVRQLAANLLHGDFVRHQ